MLMPAITRPALRYHGGKWNLGSWILSHFPAHEHYVEVFGGGASVLLQKRPAAIETYNDIDKAIVTFFKVLRDRPGELIRLIELTPWAREELKLSRHPVEDELEQARRVFVGAWMGRGKATAQWSTGWRYEVTPVRGTRAYNDIVGVEANLMAIAERLKHVQIECDDWRSVIARYDRPGTLFYCDPPYISSSRSERWKAKAYLHELSDDDHRELAGVLQSIQGMAVISGYDSPLYEELYAGWAKFTKSARSDVGAAIECLWLSPAAAARTNQKAMF